MKRRSLLALLAYPFFRARPVAAQGTTSGLAIGADRDRPISAPPPNEFIVHGTQSAQIAAVIYRGYSRDDQFVVTHVLKDEGGWVPKTPNVAVPAKRHRVMTANQIVCLLTKELT